MKENFDCLVASTLSSKPDTSAFEDDLVTHDDGLPALTIQSSYPVRLESLDNAIADEIDKKVTLMSNVTEINQMLEDIKLKEEKSKHAVLEATQAGNDIFVKLEELKEMTMLAVEENDKVAAGEVFTEQSILASEAHGLQARLSNISEERNMCHTLQKRLAVAEVETVAAEKEKERSKMLEQQVQENAKLRELLMDRGQVVDALQGEMLGIFDKISQLQLRVYMQLPEPLPSSISCSVNSADNIAQLQCRVDDPQHYVDSLQVASLRLSSSFKSTDSTAQAHCRVDEPQLYVDESLLPVDEREQLQLVSPRLSSSVMSAQSHYRVDERLLPVDEVLQLALSRSSSSLKSGDNVAQLSEGVLDVHFPVDESLQLPSLSLSSLVKSSDSITQFQQRADADELLQSSSLASSEKPATFKNWSSASDTIAKLQQRAKADESLQLHLAWPAQRNQQLSRVVGHLLQSQSQFLVVMKRLMMLPSMKILIWIVAGM